MSSPEVAAVLARPKYPFNVGASARALANLGFNQLILIDKQCEVGVEAYQGATLAHQTLKTAKEFSSVTDYLSTYNSALRIALTARKGKDRPVVPLEQCLQQIQNRKSIESSPKTIHFVFGNESDGLSHQEIESCHFFCHLPEYTERPIFNLSQAVLLSLFIFRHSYERSAQQHKNSQQKTTDNTSSLGHWTEVEPSLYRWLKKTGFQLDANKKNAFSILKRMILRSAPNQKELNVLQKALQQNLRKLND